MPTYTEKIPEFTTEWKIRWSDFREISTNPLIKHFSTSYDNVVLHWKAELNTDPNYTQADKFSFSLIYDDGPISKFYWMTYTVAILKNDQTVNKSSDSGDYIADRRSSQFLADFDDRDMKKLKRKYDLYDSNFLILEITLKIPYSAFRVYEPEFNDGVSEIDWIAQLFQCIDSSDESLYWDCKLKSRDDHIFYGHRNILGCQSKALAAMFRHSSTTEHIKETVFPFPSLDGESLKVVLEYLYTNYIGNLSDFSLTNMMEITDAAEQYGLIKLKKLCGSTLWNRAAENSDECFEIIQLIDLYDLKYVKDRAFDILANKYEIFELTGDDLAIGFGGGEKGNRLEEEFYLFFRRRLTLGFGDKICQVPHGMNSAYRHMPNYTNDESDDQNDDDDNNSYLRIRLYLLYRWWYYW